MAAGLSVGILAGCSALPSQADRSVSMALPDTRTTTALGRAIAPQADAHPGRSGVHPLLDANDAFAARMLLARVAERSLDVQYYIWRQDLTGTLLFDALRSAAERGVRVRLLLDDNNTAGLDPTLAALDAHPNIEVRLFNPFVQRSLRWLGFATDFSRLNRRMHNKSFTADNQATIVGGRNVGDEYFGATDGVLFADLDVLAVGPVVGDVSADFDRYWAAESSYPVARLLPPADAPVLAELASTASRVQDDPDAAAYVRAVRGSAFVDSLLRGQLELQWTPTRMVSDDPAKALGLAGPQGAMMAKLGLVIGAAERELAIVSPYFVPTAAGTEALTAMARRGVKIKVLTNSLEATDVAAVHAGYAKRRKALLAAGITLYELKHAAPEAQQRKTTARPGGSSAASLHAKTFSIDRSTLFIGSFNFDPRSAQLNTELGFLIDSPALAAGVAQAFDSAVAAVSYQVVASDSGELVWIDQRSDGQALRHDTEPGTRFWQRAWIGLLSLLPIEWLL